MLLKLNRKSKGIGLLELMLALGLIAILIIMATRYYINAQRGSRVNQATQDTQAILAAVQNYSLGGNLSTLTGSSDQITMLTNAGLLPPGFTDPYGEAYGLTVTSLNNIEIVVTGMPTKDCQQFYQINTASVGALSGGADTACDGDDGTFIFSGTATS